MRASSVSLRVLDSLIQLGLVRLNCTKENLNQKLNYPDVFLLLCLNFTRSQFNSLSSKSETRKNWGEFFDEGELFMELIKDVANELDIDVLCHKILVNVGLLTHADRGSLFLVKGNNAQSRYLVAKLFDVTQDTGKHDSLAQFHVQMCFISIANRDCLLFSLWLFKLLTTQSVLPNLRNSLSPLGLALWDMLLKRKRL